MESRGKDEGGGQGGRVGRYVETTLHFKSSRGL